MATAQPGIFALGTRSHQHLELDVHPAATPSAIRAALGGLREPRVTAGGTNIVVGFGAELWAALAPVGEQPAGFGSFTAIEGLDGHRAPATQHDLWVWIHGTGPDIVLDTARGVVAALAPVASLALDQSCFVYKDSRDLTGFVDGTANPPIGDAPSVACVPADRPGAGGSVVITQRWVHDLAAFDRETVPDQQRVIGRTKADSVELEGDDKPPTAHIARVEIHDGDDEVPIFRRSTPFGTVGELGLYFVAFSAEQSRFDRMLAAMFGTSGDGHRDRLLDFTTPGSGSYYFAPSLEALAALDARA